MAIQFGLVLPNGAPTPANRASFCATLDRMLDRASGSFDSVWCVDHLQPDGSDQLDSFTTLAYLAGRHPQLIFGHSVICQSYRNPALIALMGATLQFLSGGRYVMGLGAGWNQAEHVAYGYPFPDAGERVEQLAETLQIITELWKGGSVTYQGRHYRVDGARCEPTPEPRPPLMLGAFGPRMLRLAARYADWWNVSSTSPSEYQRLSNRLDQACAEIGREPATLRRTWCGGCICAPTRDRALRLAGDRYGLDPASKELDLVGTPEHVVDQVSAFVELGVDYFMLDCGGFPDLTTLELLVDEVIPAFQNAR